MDDFWCKRKHFCWSSIFYYHFGLFIGARLSKLQRCQHASIVHDNPVIELFPVWFVPVAEQIGVRGKDFSSIYFLTFSSIHQFINHTPTLFSSIHQFINHTPTCFHQFINSSNNTPSFFHQFINFFHQFINSSNNTPSFFHQFINSSNNTPTIFFINSSIFGPFQTFFEGSSLLKNNQKAPFWANFEENLKVVAFRKIAKKLRFELILKKF